MLSDRDRETLLDIQHRLGTDDPRWVRAFVARQQRLPGGHPDSWPEASYAVATVLAVLLCVLMMIVGAVGPALIFAGAAGVLIWRQQRRRPGAGRPES